MDLSSMKVQVTDLPLNNQDYSSVGAQTWGGACLLAEMITQSPQHFGLATPGRKVPRVLELGAGTGLVSLATAKLLSAVGTPATIVATDFHPAVLENLEKNIADNFLVSAHASPVTVSAHASPVTVSPHFLDWSNPPDPSTAPFDEPFDVIYGADVVYELSHALWIKTCIEKFLRKPSLSSLEVTLPTEASTIAPSTHPRFHLVIPFRATHTTEAGSVEKAFPFAPSVRAGWDSPPDDASPEDAYTLAITAKEIILCEDAVWADDKREVEYIHYVISWV